MQKSRVLLHRGDYFINFAMYMNFNNKIIKIIFFLLILNSTIFSYSYTELISIAPVQDLTNTPSNEYLSKSIAEITFFKLTKFQKLPLNNIYNSMTELIEIKSDVNIFEKCKIIYKSKNLKNFIIINYSMTNELLTINFNFYNAEKDFIIFTYNQTGKLDELLNLLDDIIYNFLVQLNFPVSKIELENSKKFNIINFETLKKIYSALIIQDYFERVSQLKKVSNNMDNMPIVHFYIGRELAKKNFIDEALLEFKKDIITNNNYLSYLYSADCYFKKGDIEKALSNVRAINLLNPENLEVKIKLAEFYFKNENFKEAVNIYTDLIQCGIESETIYLNLGICCNILNDTGAALKNLQKVLSFNRKNYDALFIIGNIYRTENNSSESLKYFELLKEYYPDKYDAYYFLGNIYFLLKNYNKAADNFNAALSLEPANTKILFELGKLYLLQEKYEKSIEVLSEAAKLNPTEYIYNLYLGKAYYYLGIYDKALSAFVSVIKFDKNNFDALYNLGLTNFKLNNFSEAKNYFEQAKTINSSFADIYYYLANIALNYEIQTSDKIKVLTKAKSYLLNAIRLNNNHFESYRLLGTIYLYNEKGEKFGKGINYDKVFEYLNKSVELKPDYADVYYDLGFIYFKQKNYYAAEEKLKKALSINNEQSASYILLGDIYSEMKLYDLAIKNYYSAVTINPENAETYLKLAKLYLMEQDFSKTKNALDEAKNIDPSNSELYFIYGILYENLNKLDEAAAQYKKVLDYNPTHIAALKNLGRIFIEKGNEKESINIYSSILKITPDDIDINIALGKIYYGSNNFQIAKNYFLNVLKNDEKNIEALNFLGNIEYLNKNYDKAIDYAHKILSIDSTNKSARILSAKIYEDKNSIDEALVEYQYVNENFPADTEILNSLGRLYVKVGWFSKAETVLNKSLSISRENNYEPVVWLSYILYQNGNSNKALNLLDSYKIEEYKNENFYLLKGDINLSQNNFDSAILYFKNVLMINPSQEAAYLKLYETYKCKQELDKAIDILEIGFKKTKYNLELGLEILNYYIEKNNLTSSIETLNILKDKYPNNYRVTYYEGKIALLKKDLNKAKDLFENVINFKDDYLPAYYGLVEISQIEKEYAKGLKIINLILSINNKEAYAYYLKGKLLKYMQLNNEALHEFKKAVELVPTAPEFYYEIADLYYSQKWYDEALSYIIKTIDYSENLKYYKLYLKILKGLNKQEKIKELVENIMLKNSNDTEALFLAGEYYLSVGDDKGVNIIETILKSNPTFEEGLELVAEYNLNNGNNDNAIQLYERLLALNENSGLYNFKIGIAYYHKNDFKNALKYFLNAEKKYLRSIELLYNIGVIYKNLNEYDKSVSYLKKVLELKSDDAETFLILGNIYAYYLKDSRLAKYYWNNYLQLKQDDEESERVREELLLLR